MLNALFFLFSPIRLTLISQQLIMSQLWVLTSTNWFYIPVLNSLTACLGTSTTSTRMWMSSTQRRPVTWRPCMKRTSHGRWKTMTTSSHTAVTSILSGPATSLPGRTSSTLCSGQITFSRYTFKHCNIFTYLLITYFHLVLI